jgi:hypothetical protein
VRARPTRSEEASFSWRPSRRKRQEGKRKSSSTRSEVGCRIGGFMQMLGHRGSAADHAATSARSRAATHLQRRKRTRNESAWGSSRARSFKEAIDRSGRPASDEVDRDPDIPPRRRSVFLESSAWGQMDRLYFRCNGGHYFRSAPACPFDGWSCDGLQHAIDGFDALNASGAWPTVAALEAKGVLPDVIERILLIEFGKESSAFDALVPERFLPGGRELLAHEAGDDLH